MPKFTSGEWEVNEKDPTEILGPARSVDGSGRVIGRFILASTFGYQEPREANARLIAKAPRMYWMIQRLITALNDHIRDEAKRLNVSEDVVCPCKTDEIKAAEELLKEIEGKS